MYPNTNANANQIIHEIRPNNGEKNIPGTLDTADIVYLITPVAILI